MGPLWPSWSSEPEAARLAWSPDAGPAGPAGSCGAGPAGLTRSPDAGSAGPAGSLDAVLDSTPEASISLPVWTSRTPAGVSAPAPGSAP
jgi:hypothetical protein